MEPNGNHHLALRALPEARTTQGLTLLPRRFEVSETFTLYTRVRTPGGPQSLTWGLVNVPGDDVVQLAVDAFDVKLGWDASGHELFAQNDNTFERVDFLFSAESWVELWLVVRNGGEASGGQTYDLYARPNNDSGPPLLQVDNAAFQFARETPIDGFQVFAEATVGDGPAILDDIFVAIGERLETPAGTGYGFYPGPRGQKTIPWLGTVWDQGYPWIFHETHGWLFAAGNAPGSLWHHDFKMGWLLFVPSFYPFLYSLNESEWLYYQTGSTMPRYFYSRVREEWFTVP
jgi:hypothetical protein